MKLTNYMITPYMWMTLGNLETELMKHLLCHIQGADTECYFLIISTCTKYFISVTLISLPRLIQPYKLC